MKNCVVGCLVAILLTACGPKQKTARQSDGPLAVSAAEIPASADPIRAPASGSTGSVPQSSAANLAPNTTTTPEESIDLAEIQRRFLQTINDGIKKAEAGLKTPVIRIVGNQSRTSFAEYMGKFTYDIKKTDSIISPFLGTVSWSVNWYENGIATNIPTTLDARYAFQNGQWVIKDLVRRVNDEKSYPADEYLPYFQ